uniref:Uncharacterized protein n=1 Tax=Sphenodon punctatus TaxID=8508 RepID=A0A8D0HEZ6_SPHPU
HCHTFQIFLSPEFRGSAFPVLILSVKAPACNVPSHVTLHVRRQTKSINGVN